MEWVPWEHEGQQLGRLPLSLDLFKKLLVFCGPIVKKSLWGLTKSRVVR